MIFVVSATAPCYTVSLSKFFVTLSACFKLTICQEKSIFPYFLPG